MRIASVKRITLDEAVPVYDLTVPGTANFALAAGPFVHNSKDAADGVAGAVFRAMMDRSVMAGVAVVQDDGSRVAAAGAGGRPTGRGRPSGNRR